MMKMTIENFLKKTVFFILVIFMIFLPIFEIYQGQIDKKWVYHFFNMLIFWMGSGYLIFYCLMPDQLKKVNFLEEIRTYKISYLVIIFLCVLGVLANIYFVYELIKLNSVNGNDLFFKCLDMGLFGFFLCKSILKLKNKSIR